MSGAVAFEPWQSSFSPALSDVSPQWRHIRRHADDGICRRPVVNAKLLRGRLRRALTSGYRRCMPAHVSEVATGVKQKTRDREPRLALQQNSHRFTLTFQFEQNPNNRASAR
jgi:hypothetical protein